MLDRVERFGDLIENDAEDPAFAILRAAEATGRPLGTALVADLERRLGAPARINARTMLVVAFELRHFVRFGVAFILVGTLGRPIARRAPGRKTSKKVEDQPRLL